MLPILSYVWHKNGCDLWCLTPLSTIFQLYTWRPVLLVKETGVHIENHGLVEDKFYPIMLYQVHLTLIWGFELTTLVVIGTDCK
jgi:hypothetical protein